MARSVKREHLSTSMHPSIRSSLRCLLRSVERRCAKEGRGVWLSALKLRGWSDTEFKKKKTWPRTREPWHVTWSPALGIRRTVRDSHPGARNEQRAKLGVHAPRCLMDHKADGITREKLMHSVSVRIIFGNNPNTEDYAGKKEILVVVVGDGVPISSILFFRVKNKCKKQMLGRAGSKRKQVLVFDFIVKHGQRQRKMRQKVKEHFRFSHNRTFQGHRK